MECELYLCVSPRSSEGPCAWYIALLPHFPWGASPFSLGGFPGSEGKESACSPGNPGSIPGLGRSPGEENGSPLQCFFLKNPIDRKSLVGCSLWDHRESDMTEWLSMHACHHLGILSLNLCFVSEVWWNNDIRRNTCSMCIDSSPSLHLHIVCDVPWAQNSGGPQMHRSLGRLKVSTR